MNSSGTIFLSNQIKSGRVDNMSSQTKDDGFSLVELLIAMAIFAILLTLVAPYIREAIVTRQLTKLTENIYTSLKMAQNEAMSIGIPIVVCSSKITDNQQECVRKSDWTENLTLIKGKDAISSIPKKPPLNLVPEKPTPPKEPQDYPVPIPSKGDAPINWGNSSSCWKHATREEQDWCFHQFAYAMFADTKDERHGECETRKTHNGKKKWVDHSIEECSKRTIHRRLLNGWDNNFAKWYYDRGIGYWYMIENVRQNYYNGHVWEARRWRNNNRAKYKRELRKYRSAGHRNIKNWERDRYVWLVGEERRYKDETFIFEQKLAAYNKAMDEWDEYNNDPYEKEFSSKGDVSYKVNHNEVNPNEYKVTNLDRTMLIFNREGGVMYLDDKDKRLKPITRPIKIRINHTDKRYESKSKAICVNVLGSVTIIKDSHYQGACDPGEPPGGAVAD